MAKVVIKIHIEAPKKPRGRGVMPRPTQVHRDHSKYSRKVKHKGVEYDET